VYTNPRAARPIAASRSSGVLGELVGEALEPAREDEVRVAHEHHRNRLGEGPPHLQHAVQRRARRKRGGVRGVDHRAVGQRVRERHAELDQVGAGLGVRLADRPGGLRSGKPPIR
jgi:hypothetical protein